MVNIPLESKKEKREDEEEKVPEEVKVKHFPI